MAKKWTVSKMAHEIESLIGDYLSLMLEDSDDFREVVDPSDKEKEELAEMWDKAVMEVAKALRLTKYLK